MSAVGSVLRILGALVALVSVVFTSFIGVKILDPFTANMPAPAASLGWPAYSTIYEFAALALIGLSIVVILWMILAPVRDDLRQEQQPRGPF